MGLYESHSEPGSNGNEEVHHTLQSFSIGASPSDATWCHTQDTRLKEGGSYPSAGDTVSIL